MIDGCELVKTKDVSVNTFVLWFGVLYLINYEREKWPVGKHENMHIFASV